MSDLEGIFPARISAHLLERLPDELSQVENGTLFVPWPKPPRVGRRVGIELAFGDEPPTTLEALVVWARAPRPGIVGGFRAQLDQPPPLVLVRLRGLVETARQRLLLRDLGDQPEARVPEPMVITERVRARTSDERTAPVPKAPPAAPPPEQETLELDTSNAGEWRTQQPAYESPAGLVVQPSSPKAPEHPAPARTVDDLFADLADELAPPTPAAPIPVPYATGASYLVHYERFLQHGEVYVTTAQAPPVGASCRLVLRVPDGEPAVRVDAIVVHEVGPPQVPVSGWVAAIVDPDGQIAERLATASFVLQS